MKEISESKIDLHKAQREFFASLKTKSLEFRILQLKKSKEGIKFSEKNILQALWKDLKKSSE
jgi:aldehyde dehydrogenase (NAD+)